MATTHNFGQKGRGRVPQGKQEAAHKINRLITAPVVRVVGDSIEPEVLPINDAIRLAESMGLDLVEISPTANPPVCKVVEYSRYLYELKKKQKEIKAKSAKVVVKEIRLSPQIDDHDFNFKLKHAIEFLKEGAKVKVEVFFKGRTIVYKEQGEVVMLKFAHELIEYGKIESMPKLEGKRMLMMVTPKK